MTCLCSHVCTYYIPSLVENTKRKLQEEVKTSLASSPTRLLRAARWRGATQTLQMWLTILQIYGHMTWAFKHLCSGWLSLLWQQPSVAGAGGVEAAHGTALGPCPSGPAALPSSGTTFWSCPVLTMPSREMMLMLMLCSSGMQVWKGMGCETGCC